MATVQQQQLARNREQEQQQQQQPAAAAAAGRLQQLFGRGVFRLAYGDWLITTVGNVTFAALLLGLLFSRAASAVATANKAGDDERWTTSLLLSVPSALFVVGAVGALRRSSALLLAGGVPANVSALLAFAAYTVRVVSLVAGRRRLACLELTDAVYMANQLDCETKSALVLTAGPIGLLAAAFLLLLHYDLYQTLAKEEAVNRRYLDGQRLVMRLGRV